MIFCCRVCLNKRPEKDLTQLYINKKSKEASYTHIMKFCLGIQVVQNSTVSTKLCLKCYRKIVTFYKFKTLALKNDAHLKSLDVKYEVSLEKDGTKKVDGEPICASEFEVKLELNDETSVKAESPIHDYCSGSEDECLSVIKKIKYEFIEEETKEVDTHQSNTKETARKKRGKECKRVKIKPTKTIPTKQMCAVCGKTVIDLKTHSYLHQPLAVRKRIKCHVCDQMFSSYSARYRHNKIKHLGVREICTICNKTVAHLSRHRRLVHNKESLPHECLECGQRFISKANLDIHNRTHTKDRPFGCEECDKTFASNALLQNHIRCIHRKERSYVCQVCSKSFFKKDHLQAHMITHSKNNTYECPQCGKFYKTPRSLRSHLLLHVEENNFACEVCEQTFKRRDNLWTHMQSHDKIKRYGCKYCGVKFHRSDHRKRHEYTAHQKHLVTEDATVATSTTPPL